jgi:pimeloyl-ACP methyl ester carboxylesterase
VLPGSGSDDVFVRSAFGGPLRELGIRLHAPRPRRGTDVVAGYRADLDAAWDRADGPLLVGGVSLGAQVAARWAAARGGGVAGLLLALPAWGGAPEGAPAALAARLTADRVRRDGLGPTLDAVRADTPPWLAAELARAWTGFGPGLADALDAAAAEPGPADAELAALDVPAGVVGVSGDAVHPLAEARRWCALLPQAVLVTSTLAAFGADPTVLGRGALRGWSAARS